MKQRVNLVLLLAICFCANAQHSKPVQTLDELVALVQKNNPHKDDQIAAAYLWITSNIHYSTDSATYYNWQASHQEMLQATLRRRKGVCENYASLFAAVLGQLNIPNYIVRGTTPTQRNESHSWNAVRSSDGWHLYDPTWDGGPGTTNKYFKVEPSIFIESHVPFDPLWQLLHKPHIASGKTILFPSVADSVEHFLGLDSLHQFLAAEHRMKQAGIANSNMQVWYDYNKMNILLIKEDTYLNLFNAATDYLNKAVSCLNSFIHYRNNGFKTVKKPQEILDALEATNKYLMLAMRHTIELEKEAGNFQFDPELLKEQYEKLHKRYEEQKKFLVEGN